MQDRLERLVGPELGVEQPLGRIVEDGDEGLALVGAERELGVRATVEVQELAKARTGFAAAAVPAAGPPLGHQPRVLEREPDEAVGERHAVIAADEVMEVPPVEAGSWRRS